MDLLIAFDRVRKKGIDAALLFVGSGEQEPLLKDYVRDHDLSNVYFFGFRNQSELPKFYAVSDVFVFPSESETWGLILNEVMCAGLPVIASQEVGAVPDLVHHGENGFTFEAGNIDQLASYLEQMLQSSDLRRPMGRHSLRIISEWNYDACARGIINALAYVAREPTQVAISQSA
jgi:glycosyltransferase involved in cell wall biosynthesis